MLMFLACGQADDVLDAAHQLAKQRDWAEEYPVVEYSYTELSSPKGIALVEEGLLVTDQGLGVVSLLADGEQQIVLDMLSAPDVIFVSDERVYFSTETTIEELFLADSTSTVLVDERLSPARLVMHEDVLYWLEEGGLYAWDGAEISALCPELAAPYDLAEWDSELWITTQGDNGLWSLSDDQCSLVQVFDDTPHRMAAGQELWITTRSFRWPYGGWVVSYDGSSIIKHSESPPEPEHIVSTGEQIIWSSKQSITSFSTAPYEMLAAQTTVGGLLIDGNVLLWTDTHGGRIGSVTLATR